MLLEKKVTNGAPEGGAPLLSEKKTTNGAPEEGAPLLTFPPLAGYPFARSPPSLSLARSLPVGERSNFKKIPTHTQDHADA